MLLLAMTGEHVVGIGASGEFARASLLRVSSCDVQIRHVPLEPPCELGWVRSATAIVVDAGADALLGVAECARLRDAARPVVLIAPDAAVLQPVARRLGVAALLQSPVSLVDLECCLASLDSLQSGTFPVAEVSTEATRTVVINRARRTLRVDGREYTISVQKFDLLCYLVDKAGIAVRAADLVRDGLLRPAQAQRYKGLIGELRAHLGPARDLICAVPGYGYRFDGLGVTGFAQRAPDGVGLEEPSPHETRLFTRSA
jgi:DNA-binding response OmpR family regulator